MMEKKFYENPRPRGYIVPEVRTIHLDMSSTLLIEGSGTIDKPIIIEDE